MLKMATEKNKSKEIKLSNLLKEKLVNLDLKGKNKKQIIAELVELIAKSGKLNNKKAFFKIIVNREKLGSTGIGNGVAIPHGRSKEIRDFVLVFARKSEGIDFGALDGEKTYLFFALASPEAEVGGHLKILAEISRLFKDKFIVDLLKKAEDKPKVLKIISSAVKTSL
ncbi:MAG: PTS sugar transporter subunit IIA [Candidatus Omnitrophica bacterium]|nr:PTS sugar transporter subunit IIA [Candidatus Omnitrophota bacterium]